MKSSGKLAKRDADIGRRLKEARDRLGFTQEDFAAQVGIAKKRLASYEELRVAVRYDLALRICRQFIISEKWLATGQGGWRVLEDLAAESIVNRVPIDLPFSEAWSTYFADLYEAIFKQQRGNIRFNAHGAENHLFAMNLFRYLFGVWMDTIDPAHVGKFLTQLMDFGDTIVAHYVQHGSLPEVMGPTHGVGYTNALFGREPTVEKSPSGKAKGR